LTKPARKLRLGPEQVNNRVNQPVYGDLSVFLKPKVQSLIEALCCSLGREHD
jgi:hypothetical protein